MSRSFLVYVAGPLGKGDLVKNISRAHDAGIALLKAGLSVIVPHGSCFWANQWIAPMGNYALMPCVEPKGIAHADWLAMDLEIVRRCDAVLRLEGDSIGADMEVDEADRRGIPVFYSVENVLRHVRENS